MNSLYGRKYRKLKKDIHERAALQFNMPYSHFDPQIISTCTCILPKYAQPRHKQRYMNFEIALKNMQDDHLLGINCITKTLHM